MNQRGYTWLNEDEERSDVDVRRVSALAQKWNDLHNEMEQEQFRREVMLEDGFADYEPPECPTCEGETLVALDPPLGKRHVQCEDLYGIVCPTCEGTGRDLSVEHTEQERVAYRQMELEVVEEMLERYGARMMRPYEHWNEDEQYMEWMERER